MLVSVGLCGARFMIEWRKFEGFVLDIEQIIDRDVAQHLPDNWLGRSSGRELAWGSRNRPFKQLLSKNFARVNTQKLQP